MSNRPTIHLVCWMICVAVSAGVAHAESESTSKPASPWDDEVLQSLVGTWHGTGTVYGNEVSLTRDWSLDLAGHFVRGDMGVLMSNGFDFRALTFWRIGSPRHYEIVWMDEVGDFKTFEAVADPERREIVAQYVDKAEDGSSEWRRLVYRLVDAEHYEEQMYRGSDGEWQLIAEFRLTRSPSSPEVQQE